MRPQVVPPVRECEAIRGWTRAATGSGCRRLADEASRAAESRTLASTPLGDELRKPRATQDLVADARPAAVNLERLTQRTRRETGRGGAEEYRREALTGYQLRRQVVGRRSEHQQLFTAVLVANGWPVFRRPGEELAQRDLAVQRARRHVCRRHPVAGQLPTARPLGQLGPVPRSGGHVVDADGSSLRLSWFSGGCCGRSSEPANRHRCCR